MSQAQPDPYQVLGLTPAASATEIKAAYRALVKRHHPDAGGDAGAMRAVNAAWEVLGDGERRRQHDLRHSPSSRRDAAPAGSPAAAGPTRHSSEEQLHDWLRHVYAPIDRLLGQVITPFPARIRDLAADPYDDRLMEAFCGYLNQSRSRLETVEDLYRSRPCPIQARGFGLSLYHCLSEVQDALAELERYTLGYVDRYLHDGREMLREAAQRRERLQQERRRLDG
ncbi:MAG: J domain-containing protein [Synechococcaceae cyanobacterium]|nr:J domain-containing protein [Synechococcaceae cyanobacterium]